MKGILIDTDKTFHLHMSLSIRSNGKNVDIYLRNNFNYNYNYKGNDWKLKKLLIIRQILLARTIGNV